MARSTSENFVDIIAGCRKRNRDSQNALYKSYYPYGMSVCFRYVSEEAEAITVLNDSFLKVFRNIRRFDVERPFEPWFRRIIINTAINHLKRQHKLKREVGMEQAKNISIREEILSRISYKELMAMVQSLSAAYRTVFNMYVIDGYKHQEIAEILGISVGTSKSNLTRARAKLRELVKNQLQQDYV